jgi:uncharacterized protein YcnI
VTISPETATQGGDATLSFQVPNEMDNAVTTKVQVFFPSAQPLASVAIKPHPGWSYQVTTRKLSTPISSDDGSVSQVVSRVTWRADSRQSAIQPGEFDSFDISVGPLPKSSTMVFKTLQTYSNGQIVRWIDPTTSGAGEPQHPAPTLTLVPEGQGTTSATTDMPPMTSMTSSDDNGRVTTALVLSLVALLVAVAAGAIGLRRRSRS